MTKFTIELEDEYIVGMRNGASVTVRTTEIASVLANLCEYGIGQKLRDSASAATKVADETKTEVQTVAQGMMNDCLASLIKGEWSHRGTGEGVDPRTSVARSIVRKAIKEKFGSKSPEWAKFTGMEPRDQNAKLDEVYAANAATFDPAIDEELARRAKNAKDKQKLANKLEISL